MIVQTARPFNTDYRRLPNSIKDKVDKQLSLLLSKPQHPSLGIKKIKGHPNIWEGRVTQSYRFTFQIIGEIYLLRRIGTHDILKTP